MGAAEAYTRAKCTHNRTEERCEAAGMEYQPVVFESPGGVSREGEKVLKSLSRMVADNTNTPISEVAHRLWGRISVDMQRAGHRAFARRAGAAAAAGGDGGQAWKALEVLEPAGGSFF